VGFSPPKTTSNGASPEVAADGGGQQQVFFLKRAEAERNRQEPCDPSPLLNVNITAELM